MMASGDFGKFCRKVPRADKRAAGFTMIYAEQTALLGKEIRRQVRVVLREFRIAFAMTNGQSQSSEVVHDSRCKEDARVEHDDSCKVFSDAGAGETVTPAAAQDWNLQQVMQVGANSDDNCERLYSFESQKHDRLQSAGDGLAKRKQRRIYQPQYFRGKCLV